jgi:hypothetical protein
MPNTGIARAMSKAEDYRKRGAAITRNGKWRTIQSDRTGLNKTVKALNDMADNEDWLAGQTKVIKRQKPMPP